MISMHRAIGTAGHFGRTQRLEEYRGEPATYERRRASREYGQRKGVKEVKEASTLRVMSLISILLL